MKNQALWQPSKYVMRRGKLRASRNPREVSVASRLMVDLTAEGYDRYLPVYAKGHLVDLGCGKVPFFGRYRAYVSAVTTVDWPHSLHGTDHVDLVCDLNQVLPLPANACDTVILSEVMEHLAQPDVVWAEMHRILRPGGCALISVPFLYPIHEAPHDYFRYTRFSLLHFASAHQFTVRVLEPFGGWAETMTDLLAKGLTRIPLAGVALSRLVQAIGQGWRTTRWGKRMARVSGATFPLGYFMVVEKPIT